MFQCLFAQKWGQCRSFGDLGIVRGSIDEASGGLQGESTLMLAIINRTPAAKGPSCEVA